MTEQPEKSLIDFSIASLWPTWWREIAAKQELSMTEQVSIEDTKRIAQNRRCVAIINKVWGADVAYLSENGTIHSRLVLGKMPGRNWVPPFVRSTFDLREQENGQAASR